MTPPIQSKFLSRFAVPLVLSSMAALPAFAAPQVNPDSYNTTSGQSITFNPLENDDGSGLFIEQLDSPPWQDGSTGTNSFSGSSVTYTAPAGFTGATTFWYGVKDSSGDIASAAITVNVTGGGGGGPTPETPWPVAGDDSAETQVGETITIDPLWNDTVGVHIKEANAWSEKGSQIRVENNKLVFTPGESVTGKDTFWYVISDDDGRTNAAKVTVAVTGNTDGPYPVANADEYTVDKNSFNNVLRVFDNDQGEGLYFTSDGLFAYSAKGAQTFQGSWDVVYNAPPDFTGTDNFWYTFEDSIGRTNAAKVLVNVVDNGGGGGQNNPPDAREDGLRLNTDQTGTGERAIDILANDVDPDGDTLTVTSVDAARFGSVRLSNGQVLYTPPSNLVSDAFSYTISDGRGGTDTVVATISVTVSDNIFPTITNETVTVAPGGNINLDLLANDSDPDGDSLTLDQVSGPSQGTVTKLQDGTVVYEALPGASGTDTFFYGVFDSRGGNGSGQVTINIQ